jgi:soluble lytic murein transglycosylase-like protein
MTPFTHIGRAMRRFYISCLGVLLVAAAGIPLTAAEPAKPAAAEFTAAIARQRQAVATMETSLQAQREAIRKQNGQTVDSQSFFLLLPPAPKPAGPAAAACEPLASSQIDELVADAGKKREVDPRLLRGIIQQESGFRPCAVSPKGALGLMQLMPATATELGVSDPFNPRENVDAGARFLKQLLDTYAGDVPLALGAYNAGPSTVRDAGGLPSFPETLDYVRRVLMLLPYQP